MNIKPRVLTTILAATSVLCAGAVLAADETQKQSNPANQTQTQQPAQSGGNAAQPGEMNKDSTTQSNQPSTSSKSAATHMKSLDTDKDGAISKAEAAKMQGLGEKFDSADANKDGRLDEAEFSVALSDSKQ